MKSDLFFIGEQVVVRKLKFSDEHDLYKCTNDREISKRTGNIHYPFSRKKARKLIRRSHYYIKKGESFVLGIVLKDSGKVIGVVTLGCIDKKNKNGTVGYWIGKKHRKKGYTTEAVKLILYFGFRKLKLHKISCSHFEGNIGSKIVIERSGFIFEGITRDAEFIGKKWLNILNYSLLSSEYP